MAYNETRVTICGSVASPITHTKVGTGFSRAKFRLFTAERVWDQEQRTWEDGARMFLSVSCWRMLADNAQASLNKGDPVVVTGRLTIKEVEYEGTTRPLVEIEATAIGPNLALCTAMPTRTRFAPDAVEARAAPEITTPRAAPPGQAALRFVEPQFTAPEVAGPRTAGIEKAASQVGAAESAGSQPAGSRTAGPQQPGAQVATPGTAGPETAGPEESGPQQSGPAQSGPRKAAPQEAAPRVAGPEGAAPEKASAQKTRSREASFRKPPSPKSPAQGIPAQEVAPEIVAPRKPDESPLVRPGEPERPKEVAEVPF